jgi:hypothetical protein
MRPKPRIGLKTCLMRHRDEVANYGPLRMTIAAGALYLRFVPSPDAINRLGVCASGLTVAGIR